MKLKYRSIKLTSDGVEKIKNEITGDIHAKGKVLQEITDTTLDSLLKPKPVLTSTVERAFRCLKLKLEDTDWEPVGLGPVPIPPENPPKSRLTSCASFPLAECMEKIRKAENVSFLSTWLVNKESIANLLAGSAMERSGKTRILILDPSSIHVACRGIDLNTTNLAHAKDRDEIKAIEKNAKAKVHRDIMTSLKEISDLVSYRQNCERLEVGVYDSTPMMTLLIADGYVCQGIHWRDHQGSSKPHLEFTREQNPLLYQAALDHYNAIWNSRTTYLYDVGVRKIIRGAKLLEMLRTAKEN